MSLAVCHAVCVCVRCISLDGEGNVLYPVFSSYVCYAMESGELYVACCVLGSSVSHISARLHRNCHWLRVGSYVSSRYDEKPVTEIDHSGLFMLICELLCESLSTVRCGK